MAINASTPQLNGNPLIFTSGWNNLPMYPYYTKIKVQRVYWLQPDLTSSSSVVITNVNGSLEYCNMKCEVSGQSQQLTLGDQWWDAPFLACVPSGKLYIYLDD